MLCSDSLLVWFYCPPLIQIVSMSVVFPKDSHQMKRGFIRSHMDITCWAHYSKHIMSLLHLMRVVLYYAYVACISISPKSLKFDYIYILMISLG